MGDQTSVLQRSLLQKIVKKICRAKPFFEILKKFKFWGSNY